MSDYLLKGAISNALNFPSVSAEEAPRLTPFVKLAELLGSFAGQLTESGLQAIRIEYEGTAAEMNTRALTAAAVAGVLKPVLQDVNMVSAPVIARERGIAIEEVRREASANYEAAIRLTVRTERQERGVGGTVFADGKPRLIEIKGISMDAEFGRHMLYVTNADKPGFIGNLGTLLGRQGVNIATFNLGRDTRGGDAICLVEVDEALSDGILAEVSAIPLVNQAKRLSF